MKTKFLMAQTHPSEYLIHKYWARKPSNIIREYIKTYFNEGDKVADPFCGSGVFLAEAKKNNLHVEGYDVNPIAYLLSEVTANPPALDAFDKEAKALVRFSEGFKDLFTLNGNEIRYVVHEVESECPACGRKGSISNSRKIGSKYHCSACDERLSFNLEKFAGTRVVKIIDRENREYTDAKLLGEQSKKSSKGNKSIFNKKLVTNRRILAFPGMTLGNLFTPRVFDIFTQLFEKAHKIPDEKVRNAILLFLTSSVAQSSRLIPYRNNLQTGGPAWTVPGFWIAPLHLETNPIIHLQARYKKFIKGIEALTLQYQKSEGSASVRNIPAQLALQDIRDSSLDGIFFDPPYGDNVPYVEFSAVWNGFLKQKIDYANEIIVSDRKEHISSWDKYKTDIESIVALFYKKLKTKGKVVMTFNNLDPKAWKIVLEAFAKFSFACIDAKYQIPAVVSSKSQMASNTSYVGDYYCVFEKVTKQKPNNFDLFHLTNKAREVLHSRNGKAPRNLVYRIFILTILNENMDLALIEQFDDVVKPVATSDKEFFYLRDELFDQKQAKKLDVNSLIQTTAYEQLRKGKKTIRELYAAVLEATDAVGSPLLVEVKDILKDNVLFEKEYCYLQKESKTLFG